MAANRPDIVVHGAGTLSDGTETVCHVVYTLYQNLHGGYMLPARGSVLVQDNECTQDILLKLMDPGKELFLSLEKTLENGSTGVNVRVTPGEGDPVHGQFVFVVAPYP